MEINEIINDAIHYPISDLKKFLILGLPNLVLAIFYVLLIVQAIGLDTISDLSSESILSSPLFSTFIITILLFFVVLILGLLIIEGIQLSVIRETIKGNDNLPDIELSKNFVDGIKVTILTIVMFGVPMIIYMILIFVLAALFRDYAGLFVILLTILFIIAMIFISLIITTSLGRLAETDSLTEALKIGEVYEIAKTIGLKNIFFVIILCGLLNLIISTISSFLGYIPIIGFVITIYILYNYYMIASSRSYGLLYRYRNKETNPPQPMYQQPMNNYQIANDEENESKALISDTNIEQNQLDFNPNNNVEENTITENNFEESTIAESSIDENTIERSTSPKTCNNCGHTNPEYANICANCGKEL